MRSEGNAQPACRLALLNEERRPDLNPGDKMDERLPSELADALRPGLPDLAEEIITAIGREVPEYRRPLEGPFGRGLGAGVERALGRFVDTLVDPAADDGAIREIYVEL